MRLNSIFQCKEACLISTLFATIHAFSIEKSSCELQCSLELSENYTLDKSLQFNEDNLTFILYYSPNSPASQNVIHFLEQTGKTVPMKNVLEDRNYEEELLIFGGKKQVPCLFIDGKAYYDPHEIIGYLAKS